MTGFQNFWSPDSDDGDDDGNDFDDVVDDVSAAECTDGRPSLLPTDDHRGAASTSLFVIIGDDHDVETIRYIPSLSDDHHGVELCLPL